MAVPLPELGDVGPMTDNVRDAETGVKGEPERAADLGPPVLGPEIFDQLFD